MKPGIVLNVVIPRIGKRHCDWKDCIENQDNRHDYTIWMFWVALILVLLICFLYTFQAFNGFLGRTEERVSLAQFNVHPDVCSMHNLSRGTW